MEPEPSPTTLPPITSEAPLSSAQNVQIVPHPRDERLIAVFEALSRILATRFLLMLALIGAFSLALMAMDKQSAMGLAVLVSYALLVVAPLVWLEVKGKRGI